MRELPDRRSRIQFFHSRRDLRPTRVRVTRKRKGVSGGHLFMAPKIGPGQNGPMILDNSGNTVWFRPLAPRREADNFRVDRLGGKPVLSWWEGFTNFGTGNGTVKVLDDRYRQIHEIKAGNGFDGIDPHEFQLTPRGTAFIVILSTVYRDLSSIGGAKPAQVLDSVVQEIDIPTGAGAVRVAQPRPRERARVAHQAAEGQGASLRLFPHQLGGAVHGGGLLSGRNTWAVYKIDRVQRRRALATGGKRSTSRWAATAASPGSTTRGFSTAA